MTLVQTRPHTLGLVVSGFVLMFGCGGSSDSAAPTSPTEKKAERSEKEPRPPTFEGPDPAETKRVIQEAVDATCACANSECADVAGQRMKANLAELLGRTVMSDEAKRKWAEGLPVAHSVQMRRAIACYEKFDEGSAQQREMSRFADKLCACADVPCAKTVHKEMTEWHISEFDGRNKPSSKKNIKLWKAAQKKYTDCYTKLLKAAAKSKPKTP